jgi:hypothetical protein
MNDFRDQLICCPWHEETQPSLCLWSDGTYFCFGCGRRGRHEEVQAKLREIASDDDHPLCLETGVDREAEMQLDLSEQSPEI